MRRQPAAAALLAMAALISTLAATACSSTDGGSNSALPTSDGSTIDVARFGDTAAQADAATATADIGAAADDDAGEADRDVFDTSAPDTGPQDTGPIDSGCASGVCCDAKTGNPKPAATICGKKSHQAKWRCVGAKLQRRDLLDGCDGAKTACSKAAKHRVWAPWKDDQTCPGTTVCVADPPKCKPLPPGPKQLTPCKPGKCWAAPTFSAVCGASSVKEHYGSGKYNVHRYTLNPKAGVDVDISLVTTAGTMKPALLLRNAAGKTLYDGAVATSTNDLKITGLVSGKTGNTAKLRIKAAKSTKLDLYVTGWSVINTGFTKMLSKQVKYTVAVSADCPGPKPGQLVSPPCFDATNKVKGYYLLPHSCPPGLYTRKADNCARGTKLLIDVLYTVATQNKEKQPKYAPIKYLDLNEGSCSTVNHATHDDGTHADLTAGCATTVSCKDNDPAIQLAKMFVDTGQVCGIIFNDTAVQKVVNAYFKSKFKYKPWHGTFMRSVGSHTHHFHVRVMKPNGVCN